MNDRKVYKFDDLFTSMTYPAGEPHIRLRPEVHGLNVRPTDHVFIIAEARDYNGLAKVWLANQLIKESGGKDITFVIPYLPFARHDRPNDVYDTSPLTAVQHILKDVDYVVVDLHSDVLGVNQFHQSEVVRLYREAGLFDANEYGVPPAIIIPDAGATKKAYSWTTAGALVLQGLKRRDPKDGKLTGFQVVANPNELYGRPCVIVDDICDGGGTFVGLAKELKKMGASELRLAVTHGLFTKGSDDLASYYEDIYTLDIYKVENTLTRVDRDYMKYVSVKTLIEYGEFY